METQDGVLHNGGVNENISSLPPHSTQPQLHLPLDIHAFSSGDIKACQTLLESYHICGAPVSSKSGESSLMCDFPSTLRSAIHSLFVSAMSAAFTRMTISCESPSYKISTAILRGSLRRLLAVLQYIHLAAHDSPTLPQPYLFASEPTPTKFVPLELPKGYPFGPAISSWTRIINNTICQRGFLDGNKVHLAICTTEAGVTYHDGVPLVFSPEVNLIFEKTAIQISIADEDESMSLLICVPQLQTLPGNQHG